ncbi:hypothetical protein M569_07688, partial [Genlisea aurea]
MSRRPNAPRRFADGGSFPFVSALHPKARRSPLFFGVVIVGTLLILGYLYRGSGGSNSDVSALSRYDGRVSCTQEFPILIPMLRKAYGDSMKKVLHVGPESCSVISQLLDNNDDNSTEAWGIEPYEMDDPDSSCRNLVQRGIVRVADIKFHLPYRSKSFSLVIASDAVDYLSPRYLNRTVPELARLSADGLVVLSGYPGQRKVKVAELPKFGRPAKYRTSSWWIRFFVQTNLEENEVATKKFEQAAAKKKKAYRPGCQVFHLK